MGARESRSQQEPDDDGTTTQDDYYTILEVDENATADEIRVSFSPPFTARRAITFFFSYFLSRFRISLCRNGKNDMIRCRRCVFLKK
jgi:hypothetical protein